MKIQRYKNRGVLISEVPLLKVYYSWKNNNLPRQICYNFYNCIMQQLDQKDGIAGSNKTAWVILFIIT